MPNLAANSLFYFFKHFLRRRSIGSHESFTDYMALAATEAILCRFPMGATKINESVKFPKSRYFQ